MPLVEPPHPFPTTVSLTPRPSTLPKPALPPSSSFLLTRQPSSPPPSGAATARHASPSKLHASSVVLLRLIQPIVCNTQVAPSSPQHQLLPVCAFPAAPEVHSSCPPQKSTSPLPPSPMSSMPPVVLPHAVSLPQTCSQEVASL